jgi:hypothetical protein
MPTILRSGPYRLFFYAGDGSEPPHVHMERDERVAKFWLIPVRLQNDAGFRPGELGVSSGSSRSIRRRPWRRGMTASRVEMDVPRAEDLRVSEDTLEVELSDGRAISVPLVWFPRLLHATPGERAGWRLIGRGEGIHWEDLDEDISVEVLLAGRASGESQESLKRCLEGRARQTT